MRTSALVSALALVLLSGCTNTAHNEAESDASWLSTDSSKKAFSHPFDGMSSSELDAFVLGRSFFTIPWVEAPSATTARDGLGPLYSANTCQHCHTRNGAGVAIDTEGEMQRALVLRLALFADENLNNVSKMQPDPVYGTQLSMNAIHDVAFEGYPKVSYEQIPYRYSDGTQVTLRKPKYRVEQLHYGSLDEKTRLSPRIALALVGLGMIEHIPEDAILANEDINDRNKDGISGKANWVMVENQKQLGRFTWKASAPSVLYQSANAAHNDMGLTSPLFPKENCTNAQEACMNATKGRHEFDLPQERLESIAYYITHLKIPKPRPFAHKEQAQKLFERLTCNRCHVERFETIDGKTIAPYSDFLLHDMGDALADGHVDALASKNEWRTPPLWGIGLYKAVSGEANYLHDGRARSIEEAILWHGGEAQGAKAAFVELEQSQRQFLIDYLGTI